MKKILVIGSGGAGKTTFAKRLSEVLEIELVHLDALYWKPGWIESSKAEWAATIDEMLRREAWVMDGNYSGTLAPRIEASDTVICLDLPRTTCIWRVLKRAIQYYHKTRPDMAEGCVERLDFSFMLWIWNYPGHTKPKVAKLLAEERNRGKAIWLRTPAEIDQFLNDASILRP